MFMELNDIYNQTIKDFSLTKVGHYPIYNIQFESSIFLAYSFMRLQEYYESPFFKHKSFSISEYIDWYKKEYDVNKFEYHKDWSGFNIPSYVVDDINNGVFSDLTILEESLLNELSKIKDEHFYIIGTHINDNAENHEIAHGLYYCSNDYKKAINSLLSQYDLSEFYQFLKFMGYHPDVYDDEVQAYSIDTPDVLTSNGFEPFYLNELSKSCLNLFHHLL